MTAIDKISELAVDEEIRTDNVNVGLFLSHFEGFLSNEAMVSGSCFKEMDRQQS